MEYIRRHAALTGALLSLAAAGAWKVWSCGGGDYDIAPALSGYPERHAVKTLMDLRGEMLAAAAGRKGPDAEANLNEGDLAVAVMDDPPPIALKKLETALNRNRAHDYKASQANFLWDLHDLASSGVKDQAPREELRAYLEWRIDAVPNEKRGLPPSAPAFGPVADQWTPPQDKLRLEAAYAQKKQETDVVLKDLSDKAAKASPLLAPHWLIVRGGIAFRKGVFDEAEHSFKEVVEKHPKHPRAETAAFMLARLEVEKYRRAIEAARREDKPVSGDAAFEALEKFATAYPKSRYAPELPGWRADLLDLQGNSRAALEGYLVQLDSTDHPEVIASACRELESCFEAITNKAESFAPSGGFDGGESERRSLAEAIAKHPLAAMRMIYFVLDGVSSIDLSKWGYHFTTTDEMRQMISRSRDAHFLAALARAVVAQEKLYQETLWKPKFLAILAWAATESGEHRQAILLCEKSPALLKASDDLQLVHGVALERAGRYADATAAYRALEQQFPESPLRKGLPVRLATTLRLNHRSGEALLEMRRASPPFEPWSPPEEKLGKRDFSLNDSHETSQVESTIAWFAPLEEMQPVAGQLAAVQKGEYSQRHVLISLRTRLLARESFEQAHALLDSPDETEEDDDNESLLYGKGFTQGRWNRWVQPIVELRSKLATTKDSVSEAELCWALVQAWENARGKVTMPGQAAFEVYLDGRRDTTDAGLVMRQNGLFLGYSVNTINAELESVDELKQTLRYSLRTAELAKGKPLAAQALFKANECLKEMAVHSLFQQVRAFETNAAAQSRRLYNRLQKEYPNSPEARFAVWWTFPSQQEAPAMSGRMRPRHDYHNSYLVAALQGAARPLPDYAQDPPLHSLQYWDDERYRDDALGPLRQAALGGPASRVQEVLKKLREEYRPHYNSLHQAGFFNYLSDFQALLAQPGIDEAAARRYITVRLNGDIPDATEEAMKPLADFIAYQNTVRFMSPNTKFGIVTGSYYYGKPIPGSGEVEAAWDKFLTDYPNSAKREAAFFQRARAATRHFQTESRHKGEHPQPAENGATAAPAPLDDKALVTLRRHASDTSDDYQKEYPQGQYLADIQQLRGGLSVAANDYATALNLLCPLFFDPKHPELQQDSADLIVQCFEALDEPEQRPQIIATLSKNKDALKLFHNFARSHYASGPLLPYEGFVEEAAKAAK